MRKCKNIVFNWSNCDRKLQVGGDDKDQTVKSQ